MEVSLGASVLVGMMNFLGLSIVWNEMLHSVLFATYSSLKLIISVEMHL
jgi:hypothetical protein